MEQGHRSVTQCSEIGTNDAFYGNVGSTGRGPAVCNAAVSALGSRTYESVERQAIMAVENMQRVLHGRTTYAQPNTL
jgi:hypothetical protein